MMLRMMNRKCWDTFLHNMARHMYLLSGPRVSCFNLASSSCFVVKHCPACVSSPCCVLCFKRLLLLLCLKNEKLPSTLSYPTLSLTPKGALVVIVSPFFKVNQNKKNTETAMLSTTALSS